jgi:hypothetical protein
MNRKQFGICCALVICVSLPGCVLLSALSTEWSENFALGTSGTDANHPALNDGKLDTVAMVGGNNKSRVFLLKFPEVKKVRRIVIHNDNLFWFYADYLDTETSEWRNFYSMRQLRNVGNRRTQSKYLLDRLNFETNMIRINVSRTVDDYVVSTPIARPGDKIVNKVSTIGGHYLPHFRVVDQAPARIREIEVYHLAEK